MWTKEELWDFSRTLIGLEYFDASALACCTQISENPPVFIETRVVRKDGREVLGNFDRVPNRVNFILEDGKVANTYLG